MNTQDAEEIVAVFNDRELEIIVAEFMTGKSRLEARCDPTNRNGEPQFYWGYPVGHDFAPAYTSDMTAAFLFVEKLTHSTCQEALSAYNADRANVFKLERRKPQGLYWASFGMDLAAEDPHPARAIVLAGLRAVRVITIYNAGKAALEAKK